MYRHSLLLLASVFCLLFSASHAVAINNMATPNKIIHLRGGNVQTSSPPPDMELPLEAGDSEKEQAFIITLENVGDQELKSQIESYTGHPLSNYIPDDSFTIFTSLKNAHKIRTFLGVLFVGRLLPRYKQGPALSLQGSPVKLYALLFDLKRDRSQAEIDRIVQECTESIRASGQEATCSAVSPSKLLVQSSAPSDALIDALTNVQAIVWVENVPEVRPLGGRGGGARFTSSVLL